MKKTLFAIALLLVTFITVDASATKPIKAKEIYKIVTAEEVQALQKEHSDLVIIDARGAKYFDGTVIKGAKHLSVSGISSESLAKIAPNKEAPIVLYCSNENCGASSKAAHKTVLAGYAKLYKYKAGIEDWIAKKLPTEKLSHAKGDYKYAY